MSALMGMRNKYKDSFEKVHGVKLGFMSAFVKAAAAALKEIPAVNAGWLLTVLQCLCCVPQLRSGCPQ